MVKFIVTTVDGGIIEKEFFNIQELLVVCLLSLFDMHSNDIHDQLCGLTATDTL